MELVRTKGMFSFYEDGHQECCRVRKVGSCWAVTYRQGVVWVVLLRAQLRTFGGGGLAKGGQCSMRQSQHIARVVDFTGYHVGSLLQAPCSCITSGGAQQNLS